MGILEPSEDLGEGSEGLGKRRTGLEKWKDGSEGGQILDWLHSKNPMNVSDTLTEWMLLTLVDKLEAELLELRKQMGNTSMQ